MRIIFIITLLTALSACHGDDLAETFPHNTSFVIGRF